MRDVDRQPIVDHLWSPDLPSEYKAWAILDSARDQRIYSAVTHFAREKYCLYRGKLAPELIVAAPYLVQLEPEDALFNYILQLGWGNSWGVFLRAKATGEELCRHFRRFLMVEDENGKRLVFRYYDPRVFRAYLPTCQREDLCTFFGPVARYVVECETVLAMLEYTFNGSRLITQELPISVRASDQAGLADNAENIK